MAKTLQVAISRLHEHFIACLLVHMFVSTVQKFYWNILYIFI